MAEENAIGGVPNLTDKVIAYEEGTMGLIDTIDFFQELIDTGMAWKFQGSYGRMAMDLVDQGLCVMEMGRCR